MREGRQNKNAIQNKWEKWMYILLVFILVLTCGAVFSRYASNISLEGVALKVTANTAPELTMTASVGESEHTPQYVKNAAYMLSGTAVDGSGIKSLMVNGVDITESILDVEGNWNTTVTLTANGATEMTVVATDNHGKATAVTGYVYYDATPPELSVEELPKNINQNIVTVSGTATDAGSGVFGVTITVAEKVYSVNPDAETGEWSVEAELTEGTNDISVVVTDKVGNSSEETIKRVSYITAPPVLAAQNTWYTQGNPATSANDITAIRLMDSYEPGVDGRTVVESWDASDDLSGTLTAYIFDDNSLILAGNGVGSIYANENSSYLFGKGATGQYFTSMTSISGLDLLDTSTVTNMSYMFSGCSSLTELDLSSLETGNVTNMHYMFSGCGSLAELDMSGFETGNVTNMSAMFSGCRSLTKLDLSGFDTGNVTTMYNMFLKCSGLIELNVSGLETGKVTDMSSMFSDCSGLSRLDVGSFETGNVINMSSMFSGCSGLTELDLSGFETGNVTSMGAMFNNCKKLTELDVSGFDTGKVTNMQRMFMYSKSLSTLDLSGFVTGNVTTMNAMFFGCTGLSTLDVSGFDTGNVTDMGTMFGDCSGLTELDLSGFDTGKVATMNQMFFDCSQTRGKSVH